MTIEQYPSSNNIASTVIWKYTGQGTELVLSGTDSYGQVLNFTPGSEQLFLNGVLLVRTQDYTPAANGLSITLPSSLAYGDFVQIYCYSNYSISTVASSAITGAVQNTQLANSGITIGNQTIGLGQTITIPTGLTLSGLTNTFSNIPNSALINSTIIVNGNPISLGASVNITTPNTILSQKGGLIVGTGGGSVSQLTVGSDGAILTAASSQSSGTTWSNTINLNGTFGVDAIGNITTSGSVNSYNYNMAGKNILVNGGFDIWTRGTTATFTTTYQYLADKWISYTDTGTVTASQINVSSIADNSPTNVKYGMRLNKTAGTNVDRLINIYVIEGASQYIGKTLTLSFYVRAGSGLVNNTFFANVSTRASRFGATVDITNATYSSGTFNSTTFTRVSMPILITNSTITNSADLFEIEVYTNTATGTNTYYDVTGFQLEVGSVATLYSRCTPTIATEQLACMRYYQILAQPGLDANIAPIVREAATVGVWNYNLPVPMRATPSISYYTNGSPNASPTIGRMVMRDTSFGLATSNVTSITVYGATNQYMATLGLNHSAIAGSYVFSEFDTLSGNSQIGLMADY